MFFRLATASQKPWVPSIPHVGALKTVSYNQASCSCFRPYDEFCFKCHSLCAKKLKVQALSPSMPYEFVEKEVAPLILRIYARWNGVVN
jgi:hypothetical protein